MRWNLHPLIYYKRFWSLVDVGSPTQMKCCFSFNRQNFSVEDVRLLCKYIWDKTEHYNLQNKSEKAKYGSYYNNLHIKMIMKKIYTYRLNWKNITRITYDI